MHLLRTTLERRRNRWLLLGLALVVLAVGAVTAELYRIRQDLDAGREILDDIDLASVDDEGGLAAVARRAADRLDAAEDRASSSPVLRALSWVPLLGTQVNAVRDLTGTVAEIGHRGVETAEAVEGVLDSGSGPAHRLEVVRVASDELDTLRSHLDEVRLGARGWLLPPLASARRDLAIELADARSDLERSSNLAAALEQFLTGPRRYLVLGGNNAEMRSVGIPTTSGIAAIAGGSIEVGNFSAAVDGIEIPEPGVPVPVQYENLYGWLNGDRGYRTTLTTANWPEAAQIASDITDVNRYGRVDGIIYVDTVTLAVVLQVIGPVEVNGVEYTSENVLEELLYRNYLRFQTLDDSPERRALQSEVAQAVFDEMENRDYSLLALAGRLSALARGRHLLAWSADEAENELWRAFGADGSLRRDGLLVTSQELGASKLDYFVRPTIEVTARRVDDYRRVTLHVEMLNPEHGETSPYIDGGGILRRAWRVRVVPVRLLPGERVRHRDRHRHHPPWAGRADVRGGTLIRVPEDSTKEVTMEFSLPIGEDVLTVLSSARYFGTRWIVDGQQLNDRLPFEIDLSKLD